MSESEAIPTAESVNTDIPSVTSAAVTTAATITAATTEAASAESKDSSKLPIKTSGIKPPSTSRIGRICMGHGPPKAGPPPLIETQSEFFFLFTYIIFLWRLNHLIKLI